jgi:hypothetical protein
MDDKDRTIKIQQTLLDKLENEKAKLMENLHLPASVQHDSKDLANTATQTERVYFC